MRVSLYIGNPNAGTSHVNPGSLQEAMGGGGAEKDRAITGPGTSEYHILWLFTYMWWL